MQHVTHCRLDSTQAAYSMAVQNRGASPCNSCAKCLQPAVKDQAVTTPCTVDCGSQILHSGVAQTLPKVPDRTSNRIGRLGAALPDIALELVS